MGAPAEAERAERLRRVEAELEAVVRNTEDATHHIMAAAEAIMMADASDAEAYRTFVRERVMEVFEACSFQDINGQRLRNAADVLIAMDDARATPPPARRLSGPAARGAQDVVDKIFG